MTDCHHQQVTSRALVPGTFCVIALPEGGWAVGVVQSNGRATVVEGGLSRQMARARCRDLRSRRRRG